MSEIDLVFDEEIEDIKKDVEGIDLTFGEDVVVETKPKAVDDEYSLSRLSQEEQKQVLDFINKIDLNNTGQLLVYGSKSQKTVESLSTKILNETKSRDLGEVGKDITSLVTTIKGFNLEEEEKNDTSMFKIFSKTKKAKNKMDVYKIQYDSAEENIGKIVKELENHKRGLIQDIHRLDALYETNKQQFKEVTMYIIAGTEKLKHYREVDIANKRAEAEASNDPMVAQELQDMMNQALKFEKRLHDLKLSRIVCIQAAPQIKMIQNNDSELLEKLQSTINNSIPIWRTGIVMSVGLENSKRALDAQRAVTDMTNEMLRKNSEMLKQGSIDIAKETERGIIDIETIKEINDNLISTLTEVLEIQRQGIENRRNVEAEMHQIETNLKQEMLRNVDQRTAIETNYN